MENRLGLAAIVGIVSGVASAAVAGLAIWSFFMDDSGARMLDSAEGVRTALDRIAEAVAERPELLGADQTSANEVARAAAAVGQSVQTAARARDITVAPASLIGEDYVLRHGEPMMMQTQDGRMFGVALHEQSFTPGLEGVVRIDNRRYISLHESDIIRFDVEGTACQAFVKDMQRDPPQIVLSMRCD